LGPVAIGTTGGIAPRWGAALLAGLIAALAPLPLAAQETVGRPAGPSVSIDYGVLESLGPAPTLPSLLRGQLAPPGPYGAADPNEPRFPVVGRPPAAAPSADPVVLTPPGKKTVRKPARAKRGAARATPPRRAAQPPKAPKPAAPPPPAMAATPVPLSPAPPAPLAPVPAPPPVASLPPPPPLPAPPADVPPPAPVSEPIAIPKPPDAPAPPPVAEPAPLPAPPLVAEPAPPPKPMATAALPPDAARPAASAAVQILFEAGSAKLDKAATDAMTRVANSMKSDETMRIQLLAYAGAAGGSSSQARRLSLSRALAARSYLISQGVRSTRIDVRALGNKSSDGPPDRVDLMTVRR